MKLLRDKIKRDTYMCKKICNMIARGDLRDDHPQQRKSGQWSNEVRDNFIITVIKNEDFDPIKICEQITENGICLWLIDGLQRCTTVENFKAGMFALGKNISPSIVEYQEATKDENGMILKDENGDIIYHNVSYDLKGKSYSELPDKLKEDFDNCPVEVVKHLDCSDEEISRHIVRYNSGRPMVAAQKVITYMCNTAKHVRKLTKHAFFSDCANYSDSVMKNGTIDRVICESIMGLNFFDNWNKNASKTGRFLDQNATKEMFDKMSNYLDRLLNVVTPETGKLFSPKNLAVMLKLFDEINSKGFSDSVFGSFLNHFDEFINIKVKTEYEYELIKNSGDYINELSWKEIDGVKSTKDKGVIIDKMTVLNNMFESYIKKYNVERENNTLETKDFEDSITKENQDINTKNEDYTVECDKAILNFVKENVSNDIEIDDLNLYKEMIDDCVKLDSPIYKSCFTALVAVLAYACINDKDIDFESWIKIYQDKTSFSTSQKINYGFMKRNFDNYVKEKNIA